MKQSLLAHSESPLWAPKIICWGPKGSTNCVELFFPLLNHPKLCRMCLRVTPNLNSPLPGSQVGSGRQVTWHWGDFEGVTSDDEAFAFPKSPTLGKNWLRHSSGRIYPTQGLRPHSFFFFFFLQEEAKAEVISLSESQSRPGWNEDIYCELIQSWV